MKYVIAVFVALCFVVPASAGPKEDAFAIIEQFRKAYDASDPPGIVKLFSADAIFLGTRMQKPTRDPAMILKYFQESAAANLPKKVVVESYEVLQLSEAAVIFSGQNLFSQTRDGKVVEAAARFTLVITKGAEGWRISHFHSSTRPAPPQ